MTWMVQYRQNTDREQHIKGTIREIGMHFDLSERLAKRLPVVN